MSVRGAVVRDATLTTLWPTVFLMPLTWLAVIVVVRASMRRVDRYRRVPASENTVCIEVTDDGPGIAPAFQARCSNGLCEWARPASKAPGVDSRSCAPR